MQLKVKLDPGAYMPERAHDTDAGLDLRVPDWYGKEYSEIVLRDGTSIEIDTGVHIEIPEGFCGLLVSKSGLNVKDNITTTGLIDSGYTGSIVVKLHSHSTPSYGSGRIFRPGDKISQLVILPCALCTPVLVDEISGGERGDNGFGSTGR